MATVRDVQVRTIATAVQLASDGSTMSRIRPVSQTSELCVAWAQRVPSGQPPRDVQDRSHSSGICGPATKIQSKFMPTPRDTVTRAYLQLLQQFL